MHGGSDGDVMRPALYALALLAATPVLAQEPDTTDWHRYIPLAVGNSWQYDYEEYPGLHHYTAFEIIGDTVIDGTAYFTVERCTRGGSAPQATCDEEPGLIRYDEEAAVVVERLVVGGEPRLVVWPPSADGFVGYCRLDLPFGKREQDCFDGSQPFLYVRGEYGVSVGMGDDQTAPGTRKEFSTGFGGAVALSGIGVLESSFEFRGPGIVFARVGGVEYGEPAIVVGIEEGAPPEAYALTVSPNPLRGAATLQFVLDVPARLTLEVFDVRGRLVRADALGTRGAGAHDLRFEAGALPPGAYRLRLSGDGGFAAVRGVVLLP
jgi:hypothetical protein